MSRKTIHRNKIEAALGITPADIEEFAKTSSLHKQRKRQLARWTAHLARKASKT